MKLLLTSAGLTNQSITKALYELLDKPKSKPKIAFIPTAANVEDGDKDWLINDLNNLVKANFEVDIVDISAISKEIWLPRLQQSSIILFGGGNTFHLMYWLNKSGLNEELPQLLKTRVYAGISAGSCITGPTIYNSVQNLFDEKYNLKIIQGLNLVPFQFIPHLNSPHFSNITKNNLKKTSSSISDPIYALDDNSALKIINKKIQIITEGEYLTFNTK